MTIGSSADSDRVFPYRAKMHFMGCGVAMFILIGSGAFTMLGRHASSPHSAAPQTPDIVEV